MKQPFILFSVSNIMLFTCEALHYQEAKATAAFKAQIEKLQQERDEFQRMVIGNQVNNLF